MHVHHSDRRLASCLHCLMLGDVTIVGHRCSGLLVAYADMVHVRLSSIAATMATIKLAGDPLLHGAKINTFITRHDQHFHACALQLERCREPVSGQQHS